MVDYILYRSKFSGNLLPSLTGGIVTLQASHSDVISGYYTQLLFNKWLIFESFSKSG